MSKNRIVMADNSYTIRRIVALSFADEEDIELISFENGIGFREKLLELKPVIVAVDVKLPEFNGYEVCRFINNTEALKDTKVFLLKGGFEQLDENSLKGLHFVDIITKPFDSNVFVSTMKNLLGAIPDEAQLADPIEMSPLLTEDPPKVADMSEGTPVEAEEISLSDVKNDIEDDDFLAPETESYKIPEDEVIPSEEITQEDINIKRRNIKIEPIESEINPFELELEEINIKRDIERQKREQEIASFKLQEDQVPPSSNPTGEEPLDKIREKMETAKVSPQKNFGEPEIPFPTIPNDVESPDFSRKDEIAGICVEVYLLIKEVSKTKTRLELLAKKLEDLIGNQEKEKGKKASPRK
jgi:twitching motility two-component system response regulator PilH